MSENEEMATGPLSWRDVYRAVGESEARVIATINAAVTPLTQTSADHEVRLRAIEQVASAIVPLKAEEAALSIRVTALETHNAKEQGVFTTLGAGKTFLLFMAGVLSPVVAIIALINSMGV